MIPICVPMLSKNQIARNIVCQTLSNGIRDERLFGKRPISASNKGKEEVQVILALLYKQPI